MKALVLAGGFPQIALIQKLKKRGIFTLLADYYENPVAKPYCDQFFRASTLDVDAIRQIAVEQQVDFLITACTDQALLTVAKVSEDLGLPCYIDHRTALNVTNKQYMKQVFAAGNIPTAKHTVMGTFTPSEIEGMRYPLIVKPVDCNSSKGVKKVLNQEELIVAFEQAVNYSRTDTAIVEEYIEGEELSADIYVENGVAKLLSVSTLDKIPDNDKFVIFRGLYSYDKTEKVRPMVERVAQQIADSFGLHDSPMLIQMIYTGEDVYVLEFSARTGGGVKYRLIEQASGFDVLEAVIDLTLGNRPTVLPAAPKNRYIANEFIYCRPGVFDRLEGFEELKQEGVIADYYLFKWQGAVMDTVANSGDRIAGFSVQADDPNTLKEKHYAAIRRMQVLDENGENIMRTDLLEQF